MKLLSLNFFFLFIGVDLLTICFDKHIFHYFRFVFHFHPSWSWNIYENCFTHCTLWRLTETVRLWKICLLSAYYMFQIYVIWIFNYISILLCIHVTAADHQSFSLIRNLENVFFSMYRYHFSKFWLWTP